jgi:translation initiation factor IF-2
MPLGHDTGPAAPAGLVLARPAAVPSLTSHAPMPTRPVQRRAAADAGAEAAWDAAAAWSDATAGPPVRSLPAVSPAATVTPSTRPLTTAPAVAASAVQRSAAGSPVAAAVSRPAAAASPSSESGSGPGSGAAPLPAPRATPPARNAGRWAEGPGAGTPPAGLGAPLASSAAVLPSSTSPVAPAMPAVTSPTTLPSSALRAPTTPRRAGLGMPMSAPPPGTVAQRMPMATPPGRRAMPDIAARTAASPPSSPAGTTGVHPAAAGPVAAQAAPAEPRPLPVLPVSRLAAGSGSHAPAHAGHDHAGAPRTSGGPLPIARSAAGAAAPVRRPETTVPTLGSRPLRPSVSIARGAGAEAGGAPSPALPAPVSARWSGGDELPATVQALPPAPPGGDPVPLQRLAAGSGAANVSGAGASGGVAGPGAPGRATREIVFPTRDGLAPGADGTSGTAGAATGSRGTTPAPGAPAFRVAPVQRSAAGAEPALPGFAAAPASGVSRPPAMTLHHAAAPAPVYVTQAAPAQAPALQRIVADPPAAAPIVGASRPGGTGGGLPGITATPVVQRIDGAAPDPGGAPGGHSDTELDELARALFGRIRTHLRSEVIHEREAKGLSFDAF